MNDTIIPFKPKPKPQPATMGDECACPTCRSDLAVILKCEKKK